MFIVKGEITSNIKTPWVIFLTRISTLYTEKITQIIERASDDNVFVHDDNF